jgi:hypothetical protein
MQRALIVTGVMTLGCLLVFGAAALAFALFPHGGTVAGNWNGGVLMDRSVAIPVPAPAIQVGPAVVNEKGVDVAPQPVPLILETPQP